ncbi:DUF2934 domain-containing protein [Methylomarinum vadi]|uniref:DUF2934 domain-containing protein n=1 Tax=Methylomarinum vadi TaxID=438855 RepID=UPI0004DF016B|nr:DUF2934 domain-containing protein [Methylomarinum vadi]
MNDSHHLINIFPDNLDEEILRSYIAEAAYYKAEKRGFEPGHELQDWLEAEKEIKECLSEYFDPSYFQEVTH